MQKFVFAALAVLTASGAGAADLPTVVHGAAPQIQITLAPTNSEPIDIIICVRRPNSIAGLTLSRCRDLATGSPVKPAPPSSQLR